MASDDNYVKVVFKFYSKILEKDTVETMWAEIVDKQKGLYKLENIPFYAQSIASNDIIYAEFDDDEERLIYRHTLEYSGNSVIHVVIMDKTVETNSIIKIFEDMACESEKFKDGYFALEIPANIAYYPIKQKLNELSDRGIIDYAESCLSSQHQLLNN
ncbi:MAG: DUF4265 domain-containing protein [Sphingobacteriaceae bacterium]|nr:MAG: DUF4265 domain-containing protein [Sphingobacteriaceae bacterium]